MSSNSAPALRSNRVFAAGLALKGIGALCEAIAGLGLLVTAHRALLGFVDWLHRYEIAHHPSDPMPVLALNAVNSLTDQSQHFYALYLLGHGAVKLAMVAGIAAHILWAYPAGIAILGGLVAFQLHELTLSNSAMLLALCVFDALMILLIWREWSALRTGRA